jgi:hypothetical protein
MTARNQRGKTGKRRSRLVSVLEVSDTDCGLMKIGSPAVASPKPTIPADSKTDVKPTKEETPGASSSRLVTPTEEDGVLSTIDPNLKTPRTAESDGVAKTLRVEGADDTVRDKCAVMLYSALGIDSRAGKSAPAFWRCLPFADRSESRILRERAISIEKAVYTSLNGSTGNDYRGSTSLVPRLIRGSD